jgi:hypothetical protein
MAALLAGCREHGTAGDRASTARAQQTVDSLAVHTFSTTFSKTENPISESGMWANGSDGGASVWAGGHLWHGGRLWGDVQTSTGFAFGVDEPTKFGDPTAILTGAWGPAQTVTGVVRIINTPRGECCHEVELRMRTTISQFSITGYEAYCSVMSDQPYCHIARWNGPNGSYWNFETGTSEDYVKDGDVIMATARGSNPTVITLYKNGKLILQATDSGVAGGGFGAYGPFPGGNPGIGFYDNHDSNWKDFGFASFTATDASDPSAVAGSPVNAH